MHDNPDLAVGNDYACPQQIKKEYMYKNTCYRFKGHKISDLAVGGQHACPQQVKNTCIKYMYLINIQ